MTDRELMQMVLEELEELADVNYGSKTVLQALRDRLAHPESVHAIDISQERVDETVKDRHDLTCVCGAVWVGEEMVCSPRKREWVGLMDEEYEAILKEKTYWYEVAKAVEAKLKEKNNG
jgi:hypothetical protein